MKAQEIAKANAKSCGNYGGTDLYDVSFTKPKWHTGYGKMLLLIKAAPGHGRCFYQFAASGSPRHYPTVVNRLCGARLIERLNGKYFLTELGSRYIKEMKLHW